MAQRGEPTLWSPARVFVASVALIVLVGTGFAWRGVDTLVSNIERISDLGLGGQRDGAVDILLVGVDSRTDAKGDPLTEAERAMLHAGDEIGTNTDTIVLVRVPNDGSSATAISIPRDAYVDIPGLGKGKINSAYGITKQTAQDDMLADGATPEVAEEKSTQRGRQALISSVAGLTGITVDHYAEVSLLGFVLLTDAVGGVDVCLRRPVDEPMSGAYFPAGRQKLDGPQALSFVRQRHDLERGDLDRIVRQQVFMAQLVHQVISTDTLSNPTRLRELSDAVGRTVVLDEGWDLLAFLNQLQDLSAGEVTFETIPVADLNGTTSTGESVVRVEPDDVQDYVAGLVGEEAGSTDPGTTTAPAPAADPGTVQVDVFNATSVSGLAGSVSQELTALGYLPGEVGNYSDGTAWQSQVLAASETDRGAAAVAAALGGIPVVADPALAPGTVSVVLASDYAGPGSGSEDVIDFGDTSTSATPVPPAPPIAAAEDGPTCVN
ncbi:LCP family protein [Nocardia flavorosea]|uniref:LCP family protein n=1 Tax=Nocardia flavorosea TaxID=53429 RepID=UPI0007A371E8|nr:LCP family protein [Nocardia flavorosea]